MKYSIGINIAKWGEKELEEFIKDNSSLFYSFAYRYIRSQPEIEDILQDCYIKLWDNRKKIGQLSSPMNYMFTMIKNNALNRISYNSKMSNDSELDYCDDTDFYNNLIEAESSKIIADAVSSLSPLSQKVLDLVIQGKSLNEIAEELNISINSVKTVKYRAIARLSKVLPNKLFISLFTL